MTVYILSPSLLSRRFITVTRGFDARTVRIWGIYKLNPRHYNQVIHDTDSACHRPMQNKGKENQMDTGKIFLGFALIAFSVAMVINPANAAGCDNSGSVGSGIIFTTHCVSAGGPVLDPEYTADSAMPAGPAIIPGTMPYPPR